MAVQARIETVQASAYAIPTDRPESDGTFEWDKTTLVVAEVVAAGQSGIGYTYAETAAASLIAKPLAEVVVGQDAMDVPRCFERMLARVRNVGRPGLASMAIAAVDAALWDLKAKLLRQPLAALLGRRRDEVLAYGSGGFTSYTIDELQRQLGGWIQQGLGRVKLKVGRNPAADPERVRAVRRAIGPEPELFVDANGAYARKQALRMAQEFSSEADVRWLEEPVSSDDLEGLRLLRDRAPAGVEIAAGEYGFTVSYFRRMLDAGAVDVLQADASRCGITCFLQVGALCDAAGIPLSAHCAPSLHLHPACAVARLRHIEYFHDHVRIEQMLFDGACTPVRGALRPDPSRPGLGIELKRADAARFAVSA